MRVNSHVTVGASAASSARSWVTISSVPANSTRAACSCSIADDVEVVGRLVQHDDVDGPALQDGERRPRPLAEGEACRRRGRRARPRARTSPAACGCRRRRWCRGPSITWSSSGPGPPMASRGLVEPPERDPRAPRDASRRDRDGRPSSAASSVVLPEPLAPTRATRSPRPTWAETGPTVKAPLRATTWSRVSTTSAEGGAARDRVAQVPLLAGLLHLRQPLDGVADARRPLVHAAGPVLAVLLLQLHARPEPGRLRPSLAGPLGLAAGLLDEVLPLAGVGLVGGLRLRPGQRPGLPVLRPAAGVVVHRLLRQVEFEDGGRDGVEERPVVGRDQHRGGRSRRTNSVIASTPARSRLLVGSSSSSRS